MWSVIVDHQSADREVKTLTGSGWKIMASVEVGGREPGWLFALGFSEPGLYIYVTGRGKDLLTAKRNAILQAWRVNLDECARS